MVNDNKNVGTAEQNTNPPAKFPDERHRWICFYKSYQRSCYRTYSPNIRITSVSTTTTRNSTMGISSTEPSSYLLTTLKMMFQCGSLTDVSDYVLATTATKDANRTRQSSESPSKVNDTNTDTDNSKHEQSDNGYRQSNGSGSSNSVYVVPSREALEEMVRDSQAMKRQGLFDMDRFFACGSREMVSDECDVDGQQVQTFVRENDDGSMGSVFSRSAAKEKQNLQPKKGDNDAYHMTFHVSPPRNGFSQHLQQNKYRDHPEIMPRRTMSDTMSELPELMPITDHGSLSSSSSRSGPSSPKSHFHAIHATHTTNE